jgi:hypothetical protein
MDHFVFDAQFDFSSSYIKQHTLVMLLDTPSSFSSIASRLVYNTDAVIVVPDTFTYSFLTSGEDCLKYPQVIYAFFILFFWKSVSGKPCVYEYKHFIL